MYYFATIRNSGTVKFLEPRVPRTTGTSEDNITPRICVSQSINGCLSSIANNICIDSNVYIYSCKSKYVHQPTPDQVPDVFITGEQWILKPTKFDLFMVVKIINKYTFEVSNDIYPVTLVEYKEVR